MKKVENDYVKISMTRYSGLPIYPPTSFAIDFGVGGIQTRDGGANYTTR